MDTLLGKNIREMQQLAESHGLPRYAGKQLMQWVYERRVRSIDEMTNLSKVARERLSTDYSVGLRAPVYEQRSADGTVKYLFPTLDGQSVETVFIPDGERGTLCVSCQVGCKMGCAFCMTGRQGFHGHLGVCDILNRVLACPEFDRLTNIVFMGQGEPLDNLDNVLRATELLTDKEGLAWSPRRITVSTVGLPQGIERFCNESECHLAISLHHPDHEQREAIMPAERAMPIADIIERLKQYDWSHQRRLTFEYIVFSGLNNLPATQRQLARLLAGLACRVNLIRFHTIPNTAFRGATDDEMTQLRDYLTRHGITCTIRASRGEDIMAACGMLNSARQNDAITKQQNNKTT